MATGSAKRVVGKNPLVDISSQCSTPKGTIQRIAYIDLGSCVWLTIQIDGIAFVKNENVWVTLPDSFPGNPAIFSSLATAYVQGMVAVFRTQSGSGKYILLQAVDTATLNATATGVIYK